MPLTIGVPRESFPGERRVAMVPRALGPLLKAGAKITVEIGAGLEAGITDAEFEAAGVALADRQAVFAGSDIILQVRTLGANPDSGRADLDLLEPRHTLIGLSEPLTAKEEAASLASRGVTAFALELIPRITRAQSMDVLSSMATIAGYRAVILAAEVLPKMFPMLMTAAGTIKPARIFVIGAGVLGLQAIATAKRLGAVVKAYDVRPAAKQEVESLGARFVELPLEAGEAQQAGGYAKSQDDNFYRRQQELLTGVIRDSDVVITAALVPGRKAPVLITKEMVKKMSPGSVIIDLAAERGGNCALSVPGKTEVRYGVTISAAVNLASSVPIDASQMYAKNISAFLLYLINNGVLRLQMDDEIIAKTLVTHHGEVVNPRVRKHLQLSPLNTGAPAR